MSHWATAVDLFSGAGGFTTGASMAGVRVLWAANHWAEAVKVHADNHPGVAHVCQDLHQADWGDVPAHDILLASPACQGHSKARGRDRAHHDATRSTAWAVVSCAEAHRPSVVVVENVPEFGRWLLYPVWCQAMQALGYTLSPHVLDAADHGVPQHRRRLFIVGTRSEQPLMLHWPLRQYVPAADIIDMRAGRWSPIHRTGRAARTLERVEAGRRVHGDQFLTAYYGNERGGRSLHRPLGTVTTRDRYAVIRGDEMRMLSAGEYRAAMGFPATYRIPHRHRDATKMLGNAVCPPVVRDVLDGIREAA